MVETMRLMKEHEMEAEDLKFSPEHLAKLIDLADAGTINSSVAKEVFEQIFMEDIDPEKYVEEHGLKTVNENHCRQSSVCGRLPQRKRESHRLPGRTDHESNERQSKSGYGKPDSEGVTVNQSCHSGSCRV